MPGWLLSILQFFGPSVVKWAFGFLESKYPGIAAELNAILDYLGQHPNPTVAVSKVSTAVASLGVCPGPSDTVKG